MRLGALLLYGGSSALGLSACWLALVWLLLLVVLGS